MMSIEMRRVHVVSTLLITPVTAVAGVLMAATT